MQLWNLNNGLEAKEWLSNECQLWSSTSLVWSSKQVSLKVYEEYLQFQLMPMRCVPACLNCCGKNCKNILKVIHDNEDEDFPDGDIW